VRGGVEVNRVPLEQSLTQGCFQVSADFGEVRSVLGLYVPGEIRGARSVNQRFLYSVWFLHSTSSKD